MALEVKHEHRDPSAMQITPTVVEVVTPPAVVTVAGTLPPEYTVSTDIGPVVMQHPLSTPTAVAEEVKAAANMPSPFKYDEAEALEELRQYLLSTYGQHYVGKNNIQVNDVVLAQDHKEALGFWKFNAFKYILRYGRKEGYNRKDLLKAIHYAILLLHLDTQITESKKDQ